MVNVISAHLSMAKLTDITDAGGNPVLTGDLLFNPAWNATMREHVAVAGVIDLKGDGTDSSLEFIRDLEKQNIIIDAYLDLKSMTVKGKMSFKTGFLIMGEMPNIDRSSPLQEKDPKVERKTDVINKLSEMADSAPKRRAASAWPSSCTSVKMATAETRPSANDGSWLLRPASSSRPKTNPGAIVMGKPRMVKAPLASRK